MEFTDRELEVMGHALNTLYDQVKSMHEDRYGGVEDFAHYLSEIKDIQTRITDNIPKETLN